MNGGCRQYQSDSCIFRTLRKRRLVPGGGGRKNRNRPESFASRFFGTPNAFLSRQRNPDSTNLFLPFQSLGHGGRTIERRALTAKLAPEKSCES